MTDRNTTKTPAGESAKQRLRPSIRNPNFLVLNARRKLFENWITRLPENRKLMVLDVGGKIQPYRSLIEKYCDAYVGLDPVCTDAVDVCGFAEQLPFANDAFDVVICTQVLEYVSDPGCVVREIHRVLRPGGVSLLSAPAVYPQDSDHDRWRFLPPGLVLLHAPYSSVEVCAEGRLAASFCRTVNVYLSMFARGRLSRSIASYAVHPALNILGMLTDRFTRSSTFSTNYSVYAVK